MKKLASIALVALFTISTFAQRQQKKQQRPDFTVDQIAELQTKKMTLQLDLNEKQQEEILEINKRKAVERKQKTEARKAIKGDDKKPSNDEIFKIKSERMDKMIAHKAEMKKILNEAQFETWEKSLKRKGRHMKKKGKNRNMQGKKSRK
jgi:protein CpxP